MKRELFSDLKAVEAMAALAQLQRLRVFRSLVIAGKSGLTPTALCDSLQIAPSALSFHLKALSQAGLISAESSGRNLIYRAEFEQMNLLLTYLTHDCCQGQSCAASPKTPSLSCQ